MNRDARSWLSRWLRLLGVLVLAASLAPLLVGAGRDAADVAQASPVLAPPPPQNLGPVVSIPPTRVLDTRPPAGSVVTVGFDGTTGNPITAGQLTANTIRRFLINGKTFPQGTGTFTFPNTFGVLANVTIVSSTGVGGGFVTVFPGNVGDTDRPNASTVNPSTAIAFDFTAVGISPTGAPPSTGTIAIFTTNTLDVIIDVVGYFTAPDVPGWNLTGNTGTVPGTNFVGTIDAQPLVFRTNNTEAMRIDTNGNLGVGTTGPIARLEASAATGAIGLLGTSDARGIVGRLGTGTSCPGTYAIGGCAGASGATGVFGSGGSGGGVGVIGDGTQRGVVGTLNAASCAGSYAVGGCSQNQTAVFGNATAGGVGVIGNSTARGVVGTLNSTSCAAPTDGAGVYAVGGCGTTAGDGVYGQTAVPGGSFTAAAIRGLNAAGGDIFLGQSGAPQTRVARIDGTGRGFFNGGTQNSGADYADLMPSSGDEALEPGDVLAIDPENGLAVRKSSEAKSTLVAGVYSTRPSVLGVGDRAFDADWVGDVPVALVGIVPTKVSAEGGAIRPGDLLTSASIPGHAMKAPAPHEPGTIIGKALEPLPDGTGVIRVLVTLR